MFMLFFRTKSKKKRNKGETLERASDHQPERYTYRHFFMVLCIIFLYFNLKMVI
jgi:low temperature requirement protein LtrA